MLSWRRPGKIAYPDGAAPGTTAGVPHRAPLEWYYRRPPHVFNELLDALRGLLADLRTGPGAHFAAASNQGRPRRLDLPLTIKRPFLSRSAKIIQTSATMTPERLRLTYGEPSVGTEWRYVRVQVPDPLRVTYVADHSYAAGSLMQEKQRPFRDRLFETTTKLIEVEFKRTRIPVAVLGPSRVVNAFVEVMVGKFQAS